MFSTHQKALCACTSRCLRASALVWTVLFFCFVVGLSGCGSKNEEVAMAAPVAAPAPAPQPEENMDSGGSDESVDNGGGTSEEVFETPVDDGSGSDPVMTEDGSDPVMTDEPMTDENMTMNEGDGEGAAPAKPPEPPKPKTLREQAVIAFSQGYDKAAVRLLQAHLLATPAEASEILAQFRWSQTRKQPALLSRIAVGVDLKNPYASQVQQNYKPIGSVKFASNARNSRRREQPSEGGERSRRTPLTEVPAMEVVDHLVRLGTMFPATTRNEFYRNMPA